MKKTLVAAILGLATAASVMAQSRIFLDTATVPAPGPYPYITYGVGSGGTVGNFVPAGQGFTVGLYYSATAATFNDPSGTAVPDAPFILGTGAGSTASISASFPGLFFGSQDFTIPGTVTTAYLVVVAYNGADYASSSVRGHSAVFTVAPNTTASGGGTSTWFNTGFAVLPVSVVPEPSTFALAGLGLASLVIFRRRK